MSDTERKELIAVLRDAIALLERASVPGQALHKANVLQQARALLDKPEQKKETGEPKR